MYDVELMPKAIKDLKKLPKMEAENILKKIRCLEHGLNGDIKKLTNYTPEYRLRVGKYRVLFEVEGTIVVIYRVKHRQKAYR